MRQDGVFIPSGQVRGRLTCSAVRNQKNPKKEFLRAMIGQVALRDSGPPGTLGGADRFQG